MSLTATRMHVVSPNLFQLFSRPQKLNWKNIAIEVLTLKRNVFSFFPPHPMISYNKHSGHWWLHINKNMFSFWIMTKDFSYKLTYESNEKWEINQERKYISLIIDVRKIKLIRFFYEQNVNFNIIILSVWD